MAYDALTDLVDTVNRYSAGKTALSLGELARSRQLDDLASQRAFDADAAEKASGRRIKEYEEAERQRLIQRYAELGVDVKAGDTVESANRKYRTFMTNRSENLLDHFTSQLKSNAQAKREAMDRILSSTSKSADAQTNRAALESTLTDPGASAGLSSDQKNKLLKALRSGGDPDKAVKQVFDQMSNDYWFRKGAAATRASGFYQKYLDEVNVRLDKTKQIDAATLMSQLNDLERQGQDIVVQRDKHIIEASPFLSKDSIAKASDFHPITPPADPNAAMKDLPAPPKPTEAPKPAPVPVIAPAPAAEKGPELSMGETYDQSGLAGLAVSGVQKQVEAGRAPGGTAPTLPSADAYRSAARAIPVEGVKPLLFGTGAPASTSPIARADVIENRGRIDAGLNQKQVLIPATPQEQVAVERLARDFGMDEARMAKAKMLISAGDPQAIATANRMLLMVRRAAQSQPAAVTSTAPANAPIGQ